ncbi:hypothetical protein AMECASPLE_006875, partial [Ameca splendens]
MHIKACFAAGRAIKYKIHRQLFIYNYNISISKSLALSLIVLESTTSPFSPLPLPLRPSVWSTTFRRLSALHSPDMDGLRSAGRAIFRSPSMAKQSWTAGRHRKLPENWTDTRETILEGMTFNLRHFGMTLVDRPKGEQLSAAAVKRIVAT